MRYSIVFSPSNCYVFTIVHVISWFRIILLTFCHLTIITLSPWHYPTVTLAYRTVTNRILGYLRRVNCVSLYDGEITQTATVGYRRCVNHYPWWSGGREVNALVCLFVWCFTPLSTIFQLYRGGTGRMILATLTCCKIQCTLRGDL